MIPESRRSFRRDLVRASPTFDFETLNQATVYESIQGRIQRAWSEVYAREPFNVLGQGVAVLWPASEAREYECRWSGVVAKFEHVNCHSRMVLSDTVYSQRE
jgi:hypothetical protein